MLQTKNVSCAYFSLSELINYSSVQFLRSCDSCWFDCCRELVSFGTLRLALGALLRCSHSQRRSFCFVFVEEARDVLDEKIVDVVVIIVYLTDVWDRFWHIRFACSFIRVKFDKVLDVLRLLVAVYPFLRGLDCSLLFQKIINRGLRIKVCLFLVVLRLISWGRLFFLFSLLMYVLIVQFSGFYLIIHRRNLRYFIFDLRLILNDLNMTALHFHFLISVTIFKIFLISWLFTWGSLNLDRIRLWWFKRGYMRLIEGRFHLLLVYYLRWSNPLCFLLKRCGYQLIFVEWSCFYLNFFALTRDCL